MAADLHAPAREPSNVARYNYVGFALAQQASCQTYEPQIALTILDSNTHFVLWTVTKRVKDARLKDNWDKNLKESIGDLVDELKQLTTQSTVARN